jgi:integrase
MKWRPAGKHGPQRKRRVVCSEKEAKIFLAKEADASSRGSLGMVVALDWDEALQMYEGRLSAKNVVELYRADVLRVLSGLRAIAPNLGKVEPAHIQAYLDDNARALRADGFEGWASTCNNHRNKLSGFFRYLWQMRKIPYNPVSATFPFNVTKVPKRELKAAEYAKVWRKCEPEVQDILTFLLVTGCRLSEMAGAKHSDISADGTWTCTDRKGNDFVRMFLPNQMQGLVARQRRCEDGLIFHKWVTRKKGSLPGHGFVLGAPVEKRWLEDVIANRCTLAKVPKFGPHDLRHANAQWARAAGISPWHVQAQLGHSTVTTTEIYAPADAGGSKVVQLKILEILSKALKVKTV